MAERPESGTADAGGGAGGAPLALLDARLLGAELGERATLVQFSTAFCQPCRATRRVLDDVAALVPGVRHVEIDAEAHLDLVRAVGVERTPTVLILDSRGRVALRATGAPRKADVLAGLVRAL
ncbi:thioredoxin family protein [Streptomyces sp. BBFR102]|uniref:thioredoxin family protein n=1 Tax=Streptomyces sp. BBFR102 TaxID=3448171 RepID=UPI003F52B49E